MTQRNVRAGAALILLGIVVNPWLVGRLAADDASIDDLWLFSCVLLVSAACVLGGLQLLWRWVERLSWGRPVGRLLGTGGVLLAALLVAGTYWRVVSYYGAHRHTMLVHAPDQRVTPEQAQWASDFYRRSLAAALEHGWFDFDKAMAQGFQPDPVNHNHFPNPAYIRDDVILDPDRPEWLVYDNSPHGKILMAMMFFTRQLEDVGPTPGGALAQWHFHPYDKPRCAAIDGLWTVGDPDSNGVCAEGVSVTRTPEMFHVWFIDHPLGRFTEMKIVPEYGREDGFDFRTIHPVVVHFAIALFVIAVVLDLTGLATGRAHYHRAAWMDLVAAAIAAVAAVATGMTAEVMAKATHQIHQVLDLHRQFALCAMAIVLILFSWRYALRGELPRKAVTIYILLSLAGLGAIGAAAYQGGRLVYTHGVGTRAVDNFARDRYWRLVREVYQQRPAATGAHVGHD